MPKFGVGAFPKPDGFELKPSEGKVGLGATPGMLVVPPKLLELPKVLELSKLFGLPKLLVPPILGAVPKVLRPGAPIAFEPVPEVPVPIPPLAAPAPVPWAWIVVARLMKAAATDAANIRLVMFPSVE